MKLVSSSVSDRVGNELTMLLKIPQLTCLWHQQKLIYPYLSHHGVPRKLEYKLRQYGTLGEAVILISIIAGLELLW
ncbi:MAG: hypothetical protein GC178_16555 [Flavobacteriales bacterium]|nr:hypothetical protein [Flavobacteriales bacterium]